MTDFTPTRRTLRQRETRRTERQQERHVANATLRDAVRAIGGGCADDWPQEPLEGWQDGRNEVSGYTDNPECQRASGGQKSGDSDDE